MSSASQDDRASATPSLMHAASEGDVQTMKALLTGAVDVNVSNQGGQTPLMLAALMGHAEVVTLLLGAGADPGSRDRLGLTALDWSQRRGFPEVTLLLAGVSPPAARPTSKSTSDSTETKTKAESRSALERESHPQGLGPASKAAHKTFQTQQSAEAQVEAAATPPTQVPAHADSAELPEVITSTESPPDREVSIRSAQPSSETASVESEPPILDIDPEPRRQPAAPQSLDAFPATSMVLPQDPQTSEPVIPSAAPPKSFEGAFQNEAEETLTRASGPNPTSDAWITRAGSSAAEKVEASQSTRMRASRLSATKERPPVFQTSALGSLAKPGSRDAADELHSVSDSAQASTPITVWLLIAFVLGSSAFAAYKLTTYLWRTEAPKPVAAKPAEPPPEIKKPTYSVNGALAGLEISIPEPEYPAELQSAGIAGPITVRIRVNKNGRVISAASSSGDRRLRTAAVKAATQASFSPEKLAEVSPRSRVVAGSITYEFAPTTGAATSPTGATPAINPGGNPGVTPPNEPGPATSTTPADPNSPVVGDPLTNAALTVPAADYPSSAKRAGIGGTITVTVRVNRAGKVISWRSSSGDSQLRAAAIKAARKATFARDKLPGTGDVLGTITYNFTPE